MTALLGDLTESGASVIVFTHVTQNLRMCGKAVRLGQRQGGQGIEREEQATHVTVGFRPSPGGCQRDPSA